MAIDYSLPPWLIPQRSPWEALLAGVQAGSAIAATRQRGQQLGIQLRQQALQEEVMNTKFRNDQADLEALRQWWPAFSSATGDELLSTQPPVLRNSDMMGRLSLMLEKRKRDYSSAELASTASREDLATPEGQAEFWRTYQKVRGAGVTIEDASQMIERAETVKRLADSATETARHHLAMEATAAAKTERQEFDVFFDENTKRWYQWRNNAAYPVTSEEIKSLSPSTRASIYKQQIEEAEQAIRIDVPTDDKKLLKVWQDKLDEARKNRDAMLKTEGQTAAPEAPKRIRVREKATGKTGWWEGGAVPAEYETIPE